MDGVDCYTINVLDQLAQNCIISSGLQHLCIPVTSCSATHHQPGTAEFRMVVQKVNGNWRDIIADSNYTGQ